MSLFNSVSQLDKIFFAKQLHMMVKGGITLVEALEIIADQVKSTYFKSIINKCRNQVLNGKQLNVALRSFEKQFGLFFIKSIELGEEKGSLESNLEFLINQLQREYDFKNSIKQASFYPSIIMGTFMILGLAIYFYILPNITKLFANSKKELPLMTKILLFIGQTAPIWGPIIFISIAVILISLPIILRVPKLKLIFDRALLKLPILGKIIRYINLARFTQNLGTMLKSGVFLPEALSINAASVGNTAYSTVLEKIAEKVNSGQSLKQIFEKRETMIFPVLVRKMISLAESTGSLPETLLYLAEFYEDEADRMMHNITSMLEPILLIVIGAAIAFIAFAVLTPMYDLTSVLNETPK